LISEGQDRKLHVHERIVLRVHLWICVNCRRFNRQLRLIRKALRLQASSGMTDTRGPKLPARPASVSGGHWPGRAVTGDSGIRVGP